jgi:hypothetical protein
LRSSRQPSVAAKLIHKERTMRARDYLGFPLLAIGMSASTLGHHWLGLLWFWGGAAVMAAGLSIVMSGGLEEKIDKALRHYRGPGDYGNTDYHGGSSSHGHDFGGGGDGGGD